MKFIQLVRYTWLSAVTSSAAIAVAGFARARLVTPSCGAKTWRARFALNHDEHRIVFSRTT